jgi:hypothetical protein
MRALNYLQGMFGGWVVSRMWYVGPSELNIVDVIMFLAFTLLLVVEFYIYCEKS